MGSKYLTPATFNIISGLIVAGVPATINYTKDSPQVALGAFLILLSLDLGANLFRYHFKVKKLSEESEKQSAKMDDLEKSIKDLTSRNKDLKDYADKRHSFTEYELSTFKEAIEDVLDTVNTWHTPVGRDVADSQKDQYLRKSKKDLFTIINNERRANNDDRKNL